MADIKAHDGQSLKDMVVKHSGSFTGLIDFAIENNLSLTDIPVAGQVLSLSTIIDKDIANYFRHKNVVPVTGVTADEEAAAVLEGIDYWAIEVDFIVSE